MPDPVPESRSPLFIPEGVPGYGELEGGAPGEGMRGAAALSTAAPSAEALEAARQGLAIKSRSQFRMAQEDHPARRQAVDEGMRPDGQSETRQGELVGRQAGVDLPGQRRPHTLVHRTPEHGYPQ